MTANAVAPPPAADESWLEQSRGLRLLRDEQRVGTPLRLCLVGAVLTAWATGTGTLAPAVLLTLLGGLLAVSALLWRVLHRSRPLPSSVARSWVLVGLATDVLLVVLAVLADPSLTSDWYLLFLVPTLKSLFLYGTWRGARLLPFLFMPLYVLTLLLYHGDAGLLLAPPLLRRAALLLLVALALFYVARQLFEAREQARQLTLRLGQRKADVDTRATVLTQTATNLAARVLELRSLQKGMKAINASLDLSVLLRLVVDNVSEVFGGASSAIGLREADGRLRVAAHQPGAGQALAAREIASLEALAAEVLRRGEPMLVEESEATASAVRAAMAVPMVLDGESIGALVAMRVGPAPFTPDDQQRLSAFADQAALAVKNSRLYERVEQLYQEVKERSAELEAMLDSIGDAVIVTDSNGCVRLTNPVATLILGLPDEPHSRPYRLPSEVLRGGFEEHLRTTLASASGDPVLGELTVHGGNLQGNRTYQALSAALRDADERPRGVVTVLRDITTAKELEQLKTNFVSTISHELKTPLHSIKGFVDIILSEKSTGALTEVQRDFLSTVRDQTTRLERMILDLLEFSRLESGQIKLNPERLNLTELAGVVTEQLRPVAEEARVTLLCLIEEPLHVEGDRLRVEQIFYNLIGNAIKFTPPGGRVSVMAERRDEQVEVVVADTGIGIPAEERERIFERFYQVDASQTRQYGGTGLGLTICKHIVERHGGRIWVEERAGGGSAFHFTLPRELAAVSALTVDFSRLEAGA